MLYPQHDGVSRDYPGLSTKVGLAGSVSGITDLLLPQTSMGLIPIVPLRRAPEQMLAALFSRLRSRPLSQLSRQITPRTKNGHAPPPVRSREVSNLSILITSGPGEFPRVESN
ncbi:hypothetical protein CAS74_004974 [Pichia kudriavzevii]|uniref:Uncharacterized protein n=1 Tax=Pichia kudriavzevii TaxID=4909 RepID=A0A1Z8JGZ6_PICKU|nr:hypothetical protein CAS74_005127 [Pichia kudriavzevii]OUT19856.1 hypothetical protein CAS74_005130 [Pichia kudriavzevii]OUT19859.1 hypothetical protein CAS74_005135 [Pichia kudriavzevii]OUT20230.1 hypothetical protein CAS74_004974 [Pichia kudriavzevii]